MIHTQMIHKDEIASFGISMTDSGDGYLEFKCQDGQKVQIGLHLKDFINLAESMKSMTTEYIMAHPFQQSGESEEILYALKNLFDPNMALERGSYMVDQKDYENLAEYLLYDQSYKFSTEDESASETEDESASETEDESASEESSNETSSTSSNNESFNKGASNSDLE